MMRKSAERLNELLHNHQRLGRKAEVERFGVFLVFFERFFGFILCISFGVIILFCFAFRFWCLHGFLARDFLVAECQLRALGSMTTAAPFARLGIPCG